MVIDDMLNTCYVLGTVLTAKELKAFFFKKDVIPLPKSYLQFFS